MIVQFTATKARKCRGTDVKVGDTLYAVRKGDLYFVWSYLDRASAEKIDLRVSPGDATDVAANWRNSPHETTPTARRV